MAVFSAGVFPPNELWDYTTRVYARGRAKDACLTLQERVGLDVNVVLYCCWVASSGRGAFRKDELEGALDAVAEWRVHVVETLRELRRQLKGGIGEAPRPLSDDLRRVVVECELHSEHVEILILHRSMARPGTGTFDRYQQIEDSIANLLRYLTVMEVEPEDAGFEELVEVLAAAFPEENPQRIASMCQGMAFRLTAGDEGVLGR
ncbi:TIGR02444 family protein [Minwuia thermotolerans]|uniref:TIGR02444 family protein n=1 Tax=Minwuia thermotolerans TaxID=2056226 RepID=A0A2M9G758_9PROT|nr:TIGR02444 family protein [Minwuia thermotolerans]PJK31545.1 TIGR02444 family protein [Minwuia thermotolerans]